ncbi:MAG: biosynthetic-type acetolactate synthase large subunit [Butyrivibrio sp.]|uniref:biosynthetic-type acetolactate synthase large subunit n=1 Tax=Butyrivibrio sp. TaxID=28121 RepID=UPI0025D4D008|nr:biosynthetic-type acetolactate synthase large subunit [Butyrivibrio sp.]MCR5770168.1 biosynthetic-type acetolactate synthase large subunit [Butyrivibrio sp.]
MVLNGAEIVLKCLKEQGVDTIFGYPGGTILNIYDELYKHSDEFNHILTSHEQGAAHAADGYARSTGKVGVCMATSGPGSTNLVTGIATAYMDSVPMVAITCNVNLPALGKDSFQEVDINGITMPITKHGFIVKDVKNLADTLRRAFEIARSGRPGPVVVDITKDVTAAKCDYTPAQISDPKEKKKYTKEEIEKVAAMIAKSKRPFIYVGGGAVISGAYKEVRKLAKTIQAPVCDTLMGKGAFDGTDELYTGMIGMHGTKTSNYGVSKCDLLLTCGARFSDRVIGNPKAFAKGARIVQFDIDAAEINKNIKTDASIVGDLKEILTDLLKVISPMKHDEWISEIKEMEKEFPLSYDKSKLTCPYVIEELDKITKGNAIITTDVGQHQMWAAQYYKYRNPRTFLSSGGLGTMGYGLGAVIGAQMGNPDKICVNVAGDGCFRMNMNELATASRYNIPIIEIIVNNEVLGMVRQWQNLFYGQRYSQTVLTDKVDYCKVAEGLGCKAIRVTKKSEVAAALKEAINTKGPVVIDMVIEKDDKVYPMVPAGKPLTEVFDASDVEE